ncbi:NAD(P)-dependent alcohol dehydrogenase [Brevibacterium sp. VCM10]|uniref:NAD(P)-dependent alcohol dehydrogenase n=1 Tax=Brevibacterium sp. VCM10 TaxID=1381751 RepID=UPI000472DB93|nr:NAD(P)-dependent alcohol dehydrogenase [Brevibacterium sp. VCM10]
MNATAAIVNEVGGDYEFEDLKLADLGHDEVLVRIVASGICHSDESIRTGTVPVPTPAVLGHEGSGIIEQVGGAVKGFEVGDHVVLAYTYCGMCANCRSGQPSSCVKYNELNMSGRREDGSAMFTKSDGTPVSSLSLQGSFSTRSVVPVNNLTKVDKDIDLRLLGPLGCGFLTGSGAVIHGLRPETGSSVAVFGTGAVGLAAMMAAVIEGCSTIIAVDIHDSRLELAAELGATHTINSRTESLDERIDELTGGAGVDYAVDTTGVPAVMKSALNVVATGGSFAPVSASGKPLEFVPVSDLIFPKRNIIGVFMGNSVPQIAITQLIRHYREGRFPIDRLVRFFDFGNISQAVESSLSGEVVKPILVMDPSYRPA